jgi:hypothetical protein
VNKAERKGQALVNPALSFSARSLLDLHYLVSNVAVRLAVDGLGCLGAGRLEQAVDLALLFVNQYLRALRFLLGFLED